MLRASRSKTFGPTTGFQVEVDGRDDAGIMGYAYDPGWTHERRRLDAIAALYDPGTIELLLRTGVASGWCCWEAGAGSGTIAHWLAQRAYAAIPGSA